MVLPSQSFLLYIWQSMLNLCNVFEQSQMKKYILLFALLTFYSLSAQEAPDTVSVGAYITSVHNIDFKEKQYSLNMWLWLKYRKPEFDFAKYLEVPMAKSFEKSYFTVDTLDDGRIYMIMKLQCLMKDSWKIKNFPFDKQKIRFSVENSQYDSRSLIFVVDTFGRHYSKWTTSGWNIIPDSFIVSTGIKKYETAFGDPSFKKPHSEFSSFKIQIGIERDSWELFLKLFLGMYLSFLLSLGCFFIHTDHMDSRFSLSVGSLFAIIGNKYIIDSSLPETTSFTLVDALHGLTLFFVFAVVLCSIYSLKLIKSDKIQKAIRFDGIAACVILVTYILINVWLIYRASIGA